MVITKKQKSSSQKPSIRPYFGKYDTLLKYTIVPSIPLSVIAILSLNPTLWVSSEIHHFYVELFAVLLAAILSFYYIARARTLNDKFSLFIGIGFLANALIDLLHVIVSYIFMNDFLFLKYFIPQTWFVGRMFLSIMFLIAIAGYPSLSRKPGKAALDVSNIQRDEQISNKASSYPDSFAEDAKDSSNQKKIPEVLIASLILLSIISAAAAVSSLYIVFPGSVLDNFPIVRPYEIPGLVALLLALIYFYKNQLYKKSDVFYKGILGSLVIDIFGQIIMSFSTTSFDTAHNVAHVLKDAGYFVNIIGLALSSIQYNAKLKQANNDLLQREEIIHSQYEKLKETDRMKEEFINVAAHELRTPIQPILGLSEIMRPDLKGQQLEYVDVIVRNAKRLQWLTDNILDVTKIESHKLLLNKELLNLNDLVLNCINDLTVNNNYHNNERLKILYEPKNIFVPADRARISQVVSNLLSNALKFTTEGSITVLFTLNDTEVMISVKDTGQGIQPEILPNLFTKFASKSFSGTGLGLFISKSIIEAHGGKIWGNNNANGRGSTFHFSLPLNRNIHKLNSADRTIGAPTSIKWK
jgi:signal transduction histidine kinase